MLSFRILPLPVSKNRPKNLKFHKVPPDKVAEAPQPGAASQSFEQALALTTLPVGGDSKEKDKEVPPEAVDKAPKAKFQIKLKPKPCCLRIVRVNVMENSFCVCF